jgi:uncharacterized protein (UPF0548 family)
MQGRPVAPGQARLPGLACHAEQVFSLTRPAPDRLSRFISEQSALPLTYSEHGASLAAMPAGYRHDRWTADLGPFGTGQLERAAQALLHWQAQRGAGLTIVPGTPARDGATFAIVIKLPVGFVTAAGRVVRVLDEPDRRGFAYGTLPGHPEQGEEAFLVARAAARLVLTVQAFSRPRHPLARLGGPVTRALQRSTNLRYLDAMRAFMAAADRPPSGEHAAS